MSEQAAAATVHIVDLVDTCYGFTGGDLYVCRQCNSRIVVRPMAGVPKCPSIKSGVRQSSSLEADPLIEAHGAALGDLSLDDPIISLPLWCPFCRMPHVDEGEWETRRHRTHQCQSCGREWRIEGAPTCGIAAEPQSERAGIGPEGANSARVSTGAFTAEEIAREAGDVNHECDSLRCSAPGTREHGRRRRYLATLRERDATIAELIALLKDAVWAADHPLESRGIV